MKWVSRFAALALAAAIAACGGGGGGSSAPVATPIVATLNARIVEILRSPEFRAKAGATTDWAPGTPQQLAAFVDAEIAKWKRVVALAGIEVE